DIHFAGAGNGLGTEEQFEIEIDVQNVRGAHGFARVKAGARVRVGDIGTVLGMRITLMAGQRRIGQSAARSPKRRAKQAQAEKKRGTAQARDRCERHFPSPSPRPDVARRGATGRIHCGRYKPFLILIKMSREVKIEDWKSASDNPATSTNRLPSPTMT